MSQTNRMTCPYCGVEMIHHATKIDYSTSVDDSDAIDPVFGGVLEEAHTCPQCGRIELREVAAQ